MKKFTLLLLLVFTGVGAQDHSIMYSLTNSLSTDLTDYQVLIELDTQTLISEGKMQTDCDDIRFITALTSGTQLSYWVESGCNTGTTRVWVKVLSIPPGGTDIFMTFGDVSAASESNGEATFIFFDDFNAATINTSKWNVNANATIDNTMGDTDMSSAKINLSAANTDGLQSDLIPDNNIAVHSTYFDSGFGGSNSNTWSGVLGVDIYVGVQTGTLANYSYYTSGFVGTGIARSSGWHYSELYFSNNQSKIILDRGAFESTLVATAGLADSMVFYCKNEQSNFDTIFVRKYEVEVVVTGGVTLSVNDLNFIEKDIFMYPNPANAQFSIKGVQNSKVSIYDVLGKRVKEVVNYNGDYIDISNLHAGLYSVKIYTKATRIIKKIVIK